MIFTEKRLFLKISLAFCLIQLILYIPIHITYTGEMLSIPATLAVIIGALTAALSDIAAFALPVFAALVLFLSYAYNGFWHALPRVFAFSLPYIIGALPENYLAYLAYFDSAGALFFSVIITLLIVLAVSAQILALLGIMCFFFKMPKVNRFEKKTLLPILESDPFDFSKPLAKGLFFTVLVQFLLSFIRETVSTVNYIIDNEGTYMTSELITVVLSYLFLALELFVTYVVVYKIKNVLVEKRVAERSSE